MKKRVLAILLVVVMCLAMAVPAFAAEVASGTCGENLTWKLENGVLTISGTGAMSDYQQIDDWKMSDPKNPFSSHMIPFVYTTAPWWEYHSNIKTVEIKDGVTSIGESAFSLLDLTSVTIPDTVTVIGVFAFEQSTALKDVYYGGTEAQWKTIQILSDSDLFNSATIHYNSTGPAQPQPATNLPTVVQIPSTGTAVVSTQNVDLDGKTVSFEYYALKDEKGNLTNYVKLRDLAAVLNGTAAQFEVEWDSKAQKVVINSNSPYTAIGGEGTTPFSGDRAYKADTNPVLYNGAEVPMTAFRLTDDAGKGYTYYKLRDLGQLLNFNVGYSAERGVFIETNKPYTNAD